jgi:hypothetical protein
MLLGLAPPAKITCLSADVDRVVGMRKMKTALVLEPASRVRSPAITEARVDEETCQMTPSRFKDNADGFRYTWDSLCKIAHVTVAETA